MQLKILSIANPHMRAFHASWFGFFSTFFSTFAPAPLAPMFKSEATLGLKRADLVAGNLCSVSSNIFMRVVMGIVCDKLGARKGLAFLLLITSPAILGMMFVDNAAGFIICRFVIGMSLASFVACQVWCTQQFSKSIVGVANATAGGWGNLGGGITNLTMPFIFLAFMSATGEDELASLRLCFLVPLALHLASAAFVMTAATSPTATTPPSRRAAPAEGRRGRRHQGRPLQRERVDPDAHLRLLLRRRADGDQRGGAVLLRVPRARPHHRGRPRLHLWPHQPLCALARRPLLRLGQREAGMRGASGRSGSGRRSRG